jgi:hypothetical protein
MWEKREETVLRGDVQLVVILICVVVQSCMRKPSLVVEEWKSSDEVVETIESWGNQVLGIVTQQFQGGKHGKTPVLKLGKSALLSLSGIKVWLAAVEVAEETIVVNGTDEEHLGPAEGRDGINGGNTVWNIGEGEAGGDLTRPTEHLRYDVSENTKLAHAAVLQSETKGKTNGHDQSRARVNFWGMRRKAHTLRLRSTVGIEGLLVDAGGKSQWIEESGRGDNSELVFVSHLDSRSAGSTLGRGESSSRAEEGGEDGELHLCSWRRKNNCEPFTFEAVPKFGT